MVAIPLRIVIVVVKVAKWRARRHPYIEPTEIGLPIPAGNEQQRATVERPVGVKLGELGGHRRSQVHGRGPVIVDARARGRPNIEAHATGAARVEEDLRPSARTEAWLSSTLELSSE